jgi:hypothetical protein
MTDLPLPHLVFATFAFASIARTSQSRQQITRQSFDLAQGLRQQQCCRQQ